LIADEVGLGKTISAGLILRQAILSGMAKRVLILTPKSVQIQWQNELYEKFNLNVPIYDGSVLAWKPVHGARSATGKPVARDEWQAEPVVLVSSFLMRRADRQRELLDAADWDLLILDEAHHARRRGAGNAQEKGPNMLLGLMRKLQAKCRSLLLLTATPMQVHPVELWDLLDLLGLPDEWRQDDGVFLRYFQRASQSCSRGPGVRGVSISVDRGELRGDGGHRSGSGPAGRFRLEAQKGAAGAPGCERYPTQDYGCRHAARRYAPVAGGEPVASPHGQEYARTAAALQAPSSEARSA
jgi:hypothetical protein